jgi:transcriptional regulator with XRE-family HTH domain
MAGAEISPGLEPEDVKILVRWLRAIPGWGQARLAAAAGLERGSIIRYEGGQVPPRQTLEDLVSAVGLPVSFLDAYLLPLISLVRRVSGRAPNETGEDLEAAAAELGRRVSALARPRLAALFAEWGLGDAGRDEAG